MEINKIYCENNLDTMARMPDNFVDLVVTSPPYNIGQNRKDRNSGNTVTHNYDQYNDNLSKEEYFEQTKQWVNELLRVTKYHIFWNIQEVSGNKGIIGYILSEFKTYYKEMFIWQKVGQPAAEYGVCTSAFENIICISKDRPNMRKFYYHNFPNRTSGVFVSNLIKRPNYVMQETTKHKFAYPSYLPSYFIKYFSHQNDLIYDPFMGSGTTAKAAKLLNRNYIGSEISKEYCEIAEKRINLANHLFLEV